MTKQNRLFNCKN